MAKDWMAGEPSYVNVDGARIAYRHLPAAGRPRVVLIHGGAAHVGWWIDVVPLLVDEFELIVVEFSGHGDSDHREHYSLTGWAAEVAAVIGASGGGERAFGQPVHVVGHSLGGIIALALGACHPDLVLSLLVIDSTIGGRRPPASSLRRAFVHYHDSLDEAVSHFHLVPEGTVASARTLDAVARAGLVHEAEGWRWKFDRGALGRVVRDLELSDLGRIQCPVRFLYGEYSAIADAEMAGALQDALGRELPSEMVPGVYHHIPLDAPEVTAEAIRRSVAGAAGSNPAA